MLLTSAVLVAATADQPVGVALTGVRLLRFGAITDEGSTLTLTVVGRSNLRFITQLKWKAAARFGTKFEAPPVACKVEVTGSQAFNDCLDFIEATLGDVPGALKSASLLITAEHFRWRGAPEDSAGTLHLFDWKAFGRATRAQRSALNASLSCRGASASDPAFVAALRSAAEQTGIPFEQGRLTATSDIERELSPDGRLAIQVALREAFARTAADVNAQVLDWRGQPGLMTYDEAVESRFQHWGEGGRVSLPGPIKRMMKAEFPEFTLKTGRGLWFFKRMTQELALHVCFDNDRLGSIGRGFTVEIGVEWMSGPLQATVLRESLFRVFGVDQLDPCWTYSTKDELAVALSALAPFLRGVLALFEVHCGDWLDPLPDLDRLTEQTPHRGSITAREALFEALSEARRWSREAQLVRLTCGCDRASIDSGGPVVGADGRIRAHGHWSFLFRSSQRPDEGFVVFVPALGTIYSSLMRAPGRNDGPLGDQWIDTDRLLAIANDIGKIAGAEPAEQVACWRCELRTGPSSTGLDMRGTPVPAGAPEPPPSDQWWEAFCTTEGPGRPRDFIVRLDAVSGGRVRVVEGRV